MGTVYEYWWKYAFIKKSNECAKNFYFIRFLIAALNIKKIAAKMNLNKKKWRRIDANSEQQEKDSKKNMLQSVKKLI